MACHGAQRIGGAGPALLPESLGRIKKPEASQAISEGSVLPAKWAAYKRYSESRTNQQHGGLFVHAQCQSTNLGTMLIPVPVTAC